MATNINTILGWFTTGKKPIQAQFWASWQSFWHKDEQIPQSSITNLTSALNAKTEKSQFEAHKTDQIAHTDLFQVKEDKNKKGVAGGYAPLDSFTKLASQYLSIVNDLTTGGATELLSAEQGKILKGQIDAINTLLASDNVNLDTVQELVDAIETMQTSLSTILVNDLATGGTTKALTAEMGKNLKGQIDAINILLASDNLNLDTVQELVDAIETMQTSLSTILVDDKINIIMNKHDPSDALEYEFLVVDFTDPEETEITFNQETDLNTLQLKVGRMYGLILTETNAQELSFFGNFTFDAYNEGGHFGTNIIAETYYYGNDTVIGYFSTDFIIDINKYNRPK